MGTVPQGYFIEFLGALPDMGVTRVYIEVVRERSKDMNGAQVQADYQSAHQESIVTKTRFGAAMMESIGALATIALGIVGLTGTFSTTIAAIATIVLGAAIWMEGGGLASSHWRAFSREGVVTRSFESSQDLGADFLGGVAAIVLGIMALLGIASVTLVAVAALVLGASLLFSSRSGYGAESRMLFGTAGLVLGLLAVCNLNPVTLVLVALISLGVAALFGGATTSARTALELQK